jgi:DNA polymerase-4
MAKIIMHIDLNAFFATAEQIRDPSLEGKPLIVAGSSRRGIVSTASYEARKYGIHSAMPTYQALRLCPDVIIRGADFSWYQQLSREFFSFVKTYTDIIEIASIDECYADMTECMKDVKDPEAFLKDLQMKLYEKTKLKCSIGLAPTKFLAKMGSDYKKPMGITIIRRKDIKRILWPIKIQDMYGVGKKTYPRLIKLGINTIGDLVNNNNPETKKLLGKFYATLIEWAKGNGDDVVNTEPFDPKSVGRSETFLFDTNDYDEITDLLNKLCHEVSLDAQKEQKLGTTVSIVMKDSSFKTINRSKSFKEPSNSYKIIYNNAFDLFDKNFDGEPIRLIGVTLSNLIAKEDYYVQMSLFDLQRHQKESKTKILINELNNKMKKPLLLRASDLKKKDKKGKK